MHLALARVLLSIFQFISGSEHLSPQPDEVEEADDLVSRETD